MTTQQYPPPREVATSWHLFRLCVTDLEVAAVGQSVAHPLRLLGLLAARVGRHVTGALLDRLHHLELGRRVEIDALLPQQQSATAAGRRRRSDRTTLPAELDAERLRYDTRRIQTEAYALRRTSMGQRERRREMAQIEERIIFLFSKLFPKRNSAK